MSDLEAGVWPPVYDFEELEAQIKERVGTGALFQTFYLSPFQMDSAICQGDIMRINNDIPYIDEEGDISVFPSEGYCIVIGNTCDLSRDESDVKFTQISPLIRLEIDTPYEVLISLKKYKSYRKFYVPCWETDKSIHGLCADFTKICTIEKSALGQLVISARMQMVSWFLFNACLLRYLARADARYT